jgi:hypothetical protein
LELPDEGIAAMDEKLRPRLAYEATEVVVDVLPGGSVSIHFSAAERVIDLRVLLERDVVEKLAGQIPPVPAKPAY